MSTNNNVTPRALLFAVITALIVGIAGSLAIRPPGVAAKRLESTTTDVAEQVRWKVTSAFNFNLPVIGQPPLLVAEDLATISGGA